MLEASGRRPGGLTTIYRVDADTTALDAQMRDLSDKLGAALDSGDITISVREPTQTLLAALVITAADYTDRLSTAHSVVMQLAKALGQRNGDVEIDMAARQIGINLEVYTTSISRALTSYTVSNLPA